MNKLKIGLTCFAVLLMISCGTSTKENVQTEPPAEEKVGLSEEAKAIDQKNAQSIIDAGENLTKAYVFLSDNSFTIHADMRLDHRIFGYAEPSTESKKLILFSIFTDDVEGNPYDLELESHYQTTEMEGVEFKYLETLENFVKVQAAYENGSTHDLYFEKKWVIIQEQ